MSSASGNSKGPLDQFYKDCLRIGNLKVRVSARLQVRMRAAPCTQQQQLLLRPCTELLPWGCKQPTKRALRCAQHQHRQQAVRSGPCARTAPWATCRHAKLPLSPALKHLAPAAPPRPQCFSHFALYLKGREELVVTIYHGVLSPGQQPPIARVSSVG